MLCYYWRYIWHMKLTRTFTVVVGLECKQSRLTSHKLEVKTFKMSPRSGGKILLNLYVLKSAVRTPICCLMKNIRALIHLIINLINFNKVLLSVTVPVCFRESKRVSCGTAAAAEGFPTERRPGTKSVQQWLPRRHLWDSGPHQPKLHLFCTVQTRWA